MSKTSMDEYITNEYVIETSSKPIGKIIEAAKRLQHVEYIFTAGCKVMIDNASTYVLLSLISWYSTHQ
jgi:hypothetical protein